MKVKPSMRGKYAEFELAVVLLKLTPASKHPL